MENNTTAEQTTATTVIESTTQEQKTEKEEIKHEKITKTEEIRIAKSQQIPIQTISRVQPTRDPKLDSQYDASKLFTDDEEESIEPTTEETSEKTSEETSEEIVEPTEETSEETPSDIDITSVETLSDIEFTYDGPVLTATKGVNNGPSGKETYYNLPMSTVVSYMRDLGYSEEEYPYWVRDDGCKMLGNYIIVAADLSVRPKGTILPCSLGMAIVCDTGGFAKTNHEQLDIAVTW